MKSYNGFLFLFASALLLGTVTTGCAFSRLHNDLARYEHFRHEFSGRVELVNLDHEALILIAMRDSEGRDVFAYRVMSGPSDFDFKAEDQTLYFFAFDDLNMDFTFQPGEPFGLSSRTGSGDPVSAPADNILIAITAASSAQQNYPPGIVDYQLTNTVAMPGLNFNVGTVTSLDHAWFSKEQARKGLWEPYGFIADGGAGIHLLEEYDPNRIPVLFVHGINGTPRNFTAMIENLDRSRYQAWVYSYPSGLRLANLANGLYVFVETLRRAYGFDELHLIAHSLGGLVSKGALNRCAQTKGCKYLRSYTTVSTPWAGVASAKSGIKWAPRVVPVWLDIDPDSEYVRTVFDTPLPEGLPFYLNFSFKQTSIFGSGSSDGVIKLNSQLRLAAQDQSTDIRGFDEGHMSILSNATVIEKIYEHLAVAR